MDNFEGYESLVCDLWVGLLDEVEQVVYDEIWFKGKTPDSVDDFYITPREIKEEIIPSIIRKARIAHNSNWPRKEYEFSDDYGTYEDGYSFTNGGITAGLSLEASYPKETSYSDNLAAEAWSRGSPRINGGAT